jgi:hypothetical protein
MFKKHRCTFVTQVRIQSCYVKIHIEWQKSLNFNIFKIEGISTIETKHIYMGYGCIWYMSNWYTTFLLSCHGLHYIFHPPPFVEKTLSMYIVNKIEKDQYICTTTWCTDNNFNHDTGTHVYKRFWPMFPRSRSTAAWTFVAVVAKAWMFSYVSKKPMGLH